MNTLDSNIFASYWNRKKILQNQIPKFTLKSWWPGEGLSEIEEVYFNAISTHNHVLDVGAGDLRLKNKFESKGFKGEYHTQDINSSYEYTYSHLDQIKRKYSAILCLDVLEHMSLDEGFIFLDKLMSLLEDGGTIVLQTPNARCIRNPLSWDMTHRHCYNLPDLWALFTAAGFSTIGHRVVFTNKSGFVQRIYNLLGRFIITRLLGCDFADNISIIATKKSS